MYKKGELQIGDEVDFRTDIVTDAARAFLPHSCQKWVIGGKDEIRTLIEDLEQALKLLEKS